MAISRAIDICREWRHEFLMPEHVLLALCGQKPFRSAVHEVGGHCSELETRMNMALANEEQVPQGQDYDLAGSVLFGQMMDMAAQYAKYSEAVEVDVPHVVAAMLHIDESYAAFELVHAIGESEGDFMSALVDNYESGGPHGAGQASGGGNVGEDVGEDVDEDSDDGGEPWRALVTCLNNTYRSHNPLIGRQAELERTIQVLCRKDKNNPLHVGEAGVGKTVLVYGLTAMIERGEVPERLQGAHVYMMDMGTMVAGTQYRGDFEKRIKMVMEGLAAEGNAILYIDEIHNLVGAGRLGGDSSLDASNMLKPYLEDGSIRFIGSTTYDEYNRYIARQRSLVRRFQQIDVMEPSVDDAVRIVEGLLPGYEAFHGVAYADGAARYAVEATARHMSDRFLPDKAIDLIDEAGAYRETHPVEGAGRQTVDRRLLADVLGRLCKIDAEMLRERDNDRLATLETDMRQRIYGQDRAVAKVAEAVQMAKAGLADETKPMASLLFVGPTGVGKTELARVLAERMGVSLVRFDMSEYAEKHAVAKLIGSPAGYVGYEDGGLLTAAIRKTPNCVLLFDEIEKAHPDIYNIFLQVMDYAALTDNRGQRADFRNVVVIMTSNAGAQYASRASIGFAGGVSRGEAMLATVKKTFKPEFINRLTDIVVFNDMSRDMAGLILDCKLRLLQDKLAARSVSLRLADGARRLLLDRGFTPEYGAREIDRVIGSMLKPPLMREILFGRLKEGGQAEAVADGGELRLEME